MLVKNFLDDRDMYSTIASMAYNLPYEECTKDTKEGKVRRNHGKVLQLAISYGMQAKSLSNQLNISLDEAKVLHATLKQNLNRAFSYGDEQKFFCKQTGYVKTLWGRKRRFPDYRLEPFEVLGNVPKEKKMAIVQQLKRARYFDRYELINELSYKYGVTIVDNNKKIRDCETQILNSIIQGSAAEMTKVALLLIDNDEFLCSIDAKPILAIHDEIILEAPKEHAEAVTKRLEELMVAAAQQRVTTVPFKAEGGIMERWFKD